jgi:peptidoglycan/LPS O-acetylase OafA/YrhL
MSENRSNDIVQKFTALSLGAKIILVAAVVLLIASFLPWYSVDLGPFGSFDRSGWQSPGAIWSILAVLIGLVMAGQIVVSVLSPGTLPDNVSGVTWPKIHLGLAGAAAVLILIKLLNESSHLAFGFFLGIICVAALVAGAFLMFQEEQKGATA